MFMPHDGRVWSRFDGITGEPILTTTEQTARDFAQLVTDRTWQQHHSTCPAHVRAWQAKTQEGREHYAAQFARWPESKPQRTAALHRELAAIAATY